MVQKELELGWSGHASPATPGAHEDLMLMLRIPLAVPSENSLRQREQVANCI